MIAFGIPIVLLQLIVLPIVGNVLGEIEYGRAITFISFSTLCSVPLGNVLNNVRLLNNETYIEEKVSGDFNLLLIVNTIMNIGLMITGSIFYQNTIFGTVLLILFSSLNLLREYLLVAFRITLNYKNILFNNIFLGAGYLLGLLLFLLFGYWELIYLIGNAMSIIFIIHKSNILREGIHKTKLFRNTSMQMIILLVAMFLNTSLNYVDKLLIYPLMGASAVTIYYSASLMGKLVSMLISPLSNVLLSYVVKINISKKFNNLKLLLFLFIFGTIGYGATLIISDPLMKILYFNWYEEAMRLIPITNLTAVFTAITAVLNTLILRFKNVFWQLNINLITLLLYLVLSITFYNIGGLYGFAFGVLTATGLKLLITCMIFLFIKNED